MPCLSSLESYTPHKPCTGQALVPQIDQATRLKAAYAATKKTLNYVKGRNDIRKVATNSPRANPELKNQVPSTRESKLAG